MSKKQGNVKSAIPNSTHEEKAIASVYIARARQQYTTSTCDVEIDKEPQVSIAEDGAWVSACVWVAQREADLSEESRTCAAKI